MIIWLLIACFALFSRLIHGCVKTVVVLLLFGFLLYKFPELKRDIREAWKTVETYLEEIIRQ